MAVLNHTISGTLPLLAGTEGPRIAEAYIESSEPAIIIAGEEIQLGSWPIPLTTDDFTFAQAVPASIEGGQEYRAVIRYYDPGPGKLRTWKSAWFELDADTDLSTVPSASLPRIIDQETYDNVLQRAAEVLAVQATNDGIMTAVLEDEESDFAAAVTASIDGATKDALRDETATHAAGTPTEFTSSQPLTVFGNAPLSIHADGYYTHTPAAVINSAGYVQADMGPLTADHDGVYHLGADVAWPTTDVAAIALVLADGAWTDTPSPVRSRAKVHAVFYGNGIMHVSDFNSGETKYMDTGAATTAAAYVPRFADVRGSATFRPLDVQFDPATGTITVVRPDGSSVTKTVAVLVGFKPRYAIWELFEPGASTPASGRFKNMRSSVGPRVVGERAATRGDVGRIVNAAPVPVQLLKSRRSYRPASTDTITLPITTAAEIVGTGSVQITRLSAVVPSSGKLHARIRAYITTATARAVFINLVNTDDGSTIDSHRVIDGSEATGTRWIDESYDLSGMTPGITRSIAFYAVIGSGTASDVAITAGQTPSRQVEVELVPLA